MDLKKDHMSARIDFTLFPTELLFNVFEFLMPKDLLLCASVSKAWFQLANHDRLWKNICDRNWRWDQSFDLDQEKQLSKTTSWKQFYKYFARIYLKKVVWFINVSRVEAGIFVLIALHRASGFCLCLCLFSQRFLNF
jgi:adenosine deaminase